MRGIMPDNAPPQVPGHWLFGNWTQFNEDSLRFIEEAAACGDVVTIRFGPLKGYLVNHPDYIQTILSPRPPHFHKPDVVRRALSDITGKNIFTANGDFWRNRRITMQPAFHAQHIRTYADTIVAYTQRELATWQHGETVTINTAMTRLTMNVIIRTMFGTEVSVETHELGQIFTELFQLVYRRMSRYALIPPWIPVEENRQIKRHTAKIRQIVQSFMTRHRALPDHERPQNLLSMLLSATYDDGQPLSEADIMREALTIFAAGYETTAYAITFALYSLAKNPDVAATLYDEVERVVGSRPVTFDDLEHLPYTEQVMKETLRLYPTAWGFARSAEEDVTFGRYHVPQNSVILISPWTLGRDARWFPQPLQFKPERFQPQATPEIPRYAYVPFGGGARICIGNQFAMMESRLVLATLAQHYRLTIDEDFQIQPRNAAFTLRSSRPVTMQVVDRYPQAAPEFS
jgi:cytochrome P450